ncbi:MAG: LacI family DNA-binding transcriptional regulator [Acidimicrobiales bacterium]
MATRAGVHPATASRALNPAQQGRITEKTAHRVRSASAELGYLPDPTARSLRTRRSGLVGVVIPDLTNPVLAPIVRGVEESLWASGFACVLADTDNDRAREEAVIAELRARRCEGLIVATATWRSEAVRRLAEEGPATVLVTRDLDRGTLPFVAADDAAGVAASARHLRSLGHRLIAHLTGPSNLSTTRRRVQALTEVAADPAAPPLEVLVRHGPRFTVDVGRQLGARLLQERRDVTAILAGNDMIALGCLDALEEAGLHCPDDVSVVGHNDMPNVGRLRPPLTTVAIPQRVLGARAAEVLLRRLAGEHTIERHLLAVELIVRGSTAPPATSAGRAAARTEDALT